MKEKILNWLDTMIELDQQKTLVDDDGNHISTNCSLCYSNEMHITNVLKLAQICDLPFKIESRDPGNTNLKYEVSFSYRGYKFFCLESRIRLELPMENNDDENK